MQSMEIYEDWSSVCTRIYPVGYDGITLPEEFLESDIQYEKPYSRVIDFQTDLEELRKNAQKYIEENKYPKTSYTIVSNINDRMEIGDTISVLHPLVTIKTEVLEYQYDIISKKVKSLTFGNYSRDVKAKFDNIKSSINEVTQTLSKQELVIKQQTDLINSLNKTGYVYIDENEILILDKLPKQTAKNVWRFGLGGLGFSSNGYEGPFEIAITIDGQINAKFITTGTMSVARIEGLQNSLNDLLVQIQLNSDNIQSIVETQNSIKKQFDNYYTIEKVNSAITQKADSITSEVNKSISTAKQEAIDSANSSTDNKLKNYTKTVDMNSKTEQTAENITSEVSKTYSTKDETNEAKQEAIDSANSSTDNKLKNYSTTTQINSAITQKANEITTSVSSTYETKTNNR